MQGHKGAWLLSADGVQSCGTSTICTPNFEDFEFAEITFHEQHIGIQWGKQMEINVYSSYSE